jgi:hypothetical protein
MAEREDGLSGRMAVYAAAAGLATVVPVPLLDTFVARLARGAALRRVATRRGVRMTREARAILSAPGATAKSGSIPVRLARRAIQSVVPPVVIAARAEEAVSTFAAAILFDHYLAKPGRNVANPVTAEEAQRIRNAIDAAAVDGATDAIKSVPAGIWTTLVDAAKAVRGRDAEGRNPLERVVDALLDGLSDAPSSVTDRLYSRFDASLANQP